MSNMIYIGAEPAGTPGGAVTLWNELPYAGESMDVAPNYSESNNVGRTSRLPSAMTLESLNVEGSVNGDFAVTQAMETLIESVMANSLTVNASPPSDATAAYKDAKLGDTQITFSYLKVIDNTDGSKTYHLYKGCMVSEMTISSAESGSLTYSCTIIGQTRTVSTTVPSGTLTPAGAYKILTADKVIGLSTGTIEIATECYKGFTLTINSNAVGNVCIGTSGNKSIEMKNVSATLETTLKYKSDQFTPLFDAATEVAFHVSAKATDNSYWDADASRALVTSAPVNLPGKGEDFLLSATFTVLNDDTVDATLLKMGVDEANTP